MGILDGLLKSSPDLVNSANAEVLMGYEKRVKEVNAFEKDLEALSDKDLKAKTGDFRARLKAGASTEEILPEVFAVVREAAWRVLGLRHYDVQLMGGMALHEGRLAEMATGEGKTLVATLPCYLNALEDKGTVLVVTANDYLAMRDAETMGQVHRFLGLSVGLVQSGMAEEERKEAYQSDVTYLTNQELGFDYLRDHLSVSPKGVVQAKPFYFCLVDEADSILIDEARTPLIISRQIQAPEGKFATAQKIANVLQKGLHYSVNEKEQNVILTDKGYADCEDVLGTSMFNPRNPWAPFVVNSIKAKELFRKDKEYIVKGDQVQIVDAFSGRVLEGRRYTDGLHQSIEAKEGIAVSMQSQVMAQVTYQALFRSFEKLCGMTGTAVTDKLEFDNTYGLGVVQVPTALPVARRDYPDVVFRNRAAANRAMLNEVERLYKDGRPVLIGTTSVDMSDKVAQELKERDIDCQMLNAKPELVERESEIVAQAGRKGVVTVATNMAGRGTDILLGGNPAMMARIYVRNAMAKPLLNPEDLAVIPEVGEDFYPCELPAEAQEAVDAAVKALVGLLGEGNSQRDELEELVSVACEAAPVTGKAILKIRKAVTAVKAAFSEALGEEKEEVLSLGGLYVVGTSRHESRRIDNQLRGRAGRQGDPGATRFFLSLDDDIFRIFGADKTAKIMENFRLSDDIPIESKQVAETLDKVQQATEDYFAGIRRTVFQFDEVMNDQRLALYQTRDGMLLQDTEGVRTVAEEYVAKTVDDIVKGLRGKTESGGAAGLSETFMYFFPNADASQASETLLGSMPEGDLSSHLTEVAKKALDAKLTDLEGVREGLGTESARYLALTNMDNQWCTHLENMNMLKETSGLETYRGANPLDVFRDQGRELFRDLLDTVRRDTVYSLFIYNPRPAQQQAAQPAS